MGEIEERRRDLDRRAGGSAVARRGTAKPADAGPGRDTSDSSWNGGWTSFEDLGLRDPGADSSVIAYAVEVDSVVRRRRSTGRTYRIAIAWTATERAILVHRMEQELEAQPRGSFKPSSGWVKTGSVQRRARKPATVRVGDVAVDSTSPSAGSSAGASGSAPTRTSADEDSAEVATLARLAADRLAFLPAPVRASVLRRAKQPDHYYGSAWRTGGRQPGSLPRYVSQILRMNEREAVVVSASRIGDDRHWHSAQYTYDLRTHAPDRGPALGRGGGGAPEVGSGGDAAGRLGR